MSTPIFIISPEMQLAKIKADLEADGIAPKVTKLPVSHGTKSNHYANQVGRSKGRATRI